MATSPRKLTKKHAVSHLKNAVANAKHYLNSAYTNCRDIGVMTYEFRRVISNAKQLGVSEKSKAFKDARLYAREMRAAKRMHGCKVRR